MKKQEAPLPYISHILMPYFPNLKKKLEIANIDKSPEQFLNMVFFNSLLMTVFLTLFSFLIFQEYSINMLLLILIVPLVFIGSIFYFGYYPDLKIIKKRKEIDSELVFAGRHLLIALKSGMPLFDAMVGVSEGYGAVSREFNKIVKKITLGVPMSQAIREVSQDCPSKDFQRITLQIANALSSGSDVAVALEAILNQIFKEQIIKLKEYGQKLNPLMMFYMITGIIFPALGLAFLIVLLSLLGASTFGLTSSFLIIAFIGIAMVQFIFMNMVETSRPKYIL